MVADRQSPSPPPPPLVLAVSNLLLISIPRLLLPLFYSAPPLSPPIRPHRAMANRPSSLADRCLPAFSILDNYLNQNPCEIARELIDRCDGQQQQYYDLAPLDLINNIRSYRSPNPGQVRPLPPSIQPPGAQRSSSRGASESVALFRRREKPSVHLP